MYICIIYIYGLYGFSQGFLVCSATGYDLEWLSHGLVVPYWLRSESSVAPTPGTVEMFKARSSMVGAGFFYAYYICIHVYGYHHYYHCYYDCYYMVLLLLLFSI